MIILPRTYATVPYRFMRIERKDDVTVYKIDWKDLVTILETPVITSIRI